MSVVAEISPDYLRDQRIRIAQFNPSATPTAGQDLYLVFDYSAALPQGVVCPLIFEAKGTSRGSYWRRQFATPPKGLFWQPQEGGVHMLTIRESAHNRWWGSLRVVVTGERLSRG